MCQNSQVEAASTVRDSVQRRVIAHYGLQITTGPHACKQPDVQCTGLVLPVIARA